MERRCIGWCWRECGRRTRPQAEFGSVWHAEGATGIDFVKVTQSIQPLLAMDEEKMVMVKIAKDRLVGP